MDEVIQLTLNVYLKIKIQRSETAIDLYLLDIQQDFLIVRKIAVQHYSSTLSISLPPQL